MLTFMTGNDSGFSLLIPALLLISIYIAIGHYFLPRMVRLLIQHQIVELNYESKTIPTAMGLFIWWMLIVYGLLLQWLTVIPFFRPLLQWLHMPELGSYTVALSVITFSSWLDDTAGHKEIKGLGGHIRAWRHEGKLTTGMLKLWSTGLMALWMASFLATSWSLTAWYIVLIMLMTNTMNLLDLRPGRVSKVMMLLCGAMIICGLFSEVVRWLFPIVLAAAILFRQEIKAKLMLGDTGANLIGFALGVSICQACPLWFQMFIVLMTSALHWLAEKQSLTQTIAKHKWLHWLDQLGRAS